MSNVGSATGLVAIPNPSKRYTQWNITEVYGAGTAPTNVHIVNVNDSVVDWSKNILYRVIAVDNTGVPTLEPISFTGVNGVKMEESVITTGPGLCSEGYRLYVNTKLIPSPCKIDCRVLINGSENAYIKLFKGVDITNSGNVISALFNSAGRMTTENIKLEPVAIPHKTNTAYKTVMSGYITEALADGEVVTAVIYDNKGQITSQFRLLVVNTEFVRDIDASKKHIVDIDLITPYLSSNNRLLIEFPIGMVTQSSSFLGRVTYNDGSSVTYPCDDTKFGLFGWDTFLSARLGDTTPLVLNYKLSELEYSDNIRLVDDRRFVSKKYQVKTVDSDQRYNVKLFVIPSWDTTSLSWQLSYWLYSLERTAAVDVTRLVEYASNSTPFNGKLFGTEQRLTVALNLDMLGPSYTYFRHVETFRITMLHPAVTGRVSSYYLLDYDNNSAVANRTLARITGNNDNYNLDLSNNSPDVHTLLNAWFYASEPLVYPFNESQAPRPTHFRLVIGNWTREVPIDDILNPVTRVNAAIHQGLAIHVEFLRVTPTSRLHMGRVGLISVFE